MQLWINTNASITNGEVTKTGQKATKFNTKQGIYANVKQGIQRFPKPAEDEEFEAFAIRKVFLAEMNHMDLQKTWF